MILRPAWKLMNMHLPIFTEVLGYNKNINELKNLIKADSVDREADDDTQENEDDDEEDEDEK